MFKIEGKVYSRGELLSSYDLADGATLDSMRDADKLLASYIMNLLIQGGTATYSRPHNEYKVTMPDGSAEYIKPPVEVKK